MRTTVEISDPLFALAKLHAEKNRCSVSALIEEGLRRVLEADASATHYVLPDRSVGVVGNPNPLDGFRWSERWEEIYGGR